MPFKNYFIFTFFALICQFSYAASFKCDLAKTNVEKAICQSGNLSVLDENMASLYSSLIKIYSDAKPIKIWQKNWLSERNNCKDNKCLEDVYNKRILLLKSALAADTETKRWTGYYVRYFKRKIDTNSSDLLLIALDNSKIYVEGFSMWIVDTKTSYAHTGEMRGFGILKNSFLTEIVKDELCSAKFTLTDNSTLLINDESGCGGMNVTFNGEYWK